MTQTFTSEHELTQDLLELAGYRVDEDVDQQGLFVWTRQEAGRTTGGCDISLDSAEKAWNEVRWIVGEVLRDEAEIGAADWKLMSAEERKRVIIEQFC